MPLLVKYEQTGSYFSWLSKQLKNPLLPRCVRPLHAQHSTATLSEKHAPHYYFSLPKTTYQPPLPARLSLSRSENQPLLLDRTNLLSNPLKGSQTQTQFTWCSSRTPACPLPAKARRFQVGGRLHCPAHVWPSGPHSQVSGLKPFHL